MVLGFPLIAALGSWSCFTFIWNINKDVRAKMAEWKASKLVDSMNMPHVVDQLRKLEAYGLENEKKYPWMPAAWNRNH